MIDFAELLNQDIAITQITPIYQYYSAGEEISVCNRDQNALIFCSDCSIEYHCETGKTIMAEKNSIILLPEHSSYKAVFRTSDGAAKDNKISDRLIKFTLLNDKFSEDSPSVITEKVNSATRLIIDDIFSIESAKKRIKLNASFYALLNNLLCKNEANDILMRPAIDFLDSNPKFNSVSVNGLAKMCNMHPTTFRRHFEYAFGISPSQYIKNNFKEMAKYYLITEQRSVKEVSCLLGFSNVSYFSRFFKENTGFLPSEIK